MQICNLTIDFLRFSHSLQFSGIPSLVSNWSTKNTTKLFKAALVWQLLIAVIKLCIHGKWWEMYGTCKISSYYKDSCFVSPLYAVLLLSSKAVSILLLENRLSVEVISSFQPTHNTIMSVPLYLKRRQSCVKSVKSKINNIAHPHSRSKGQQI